MSLLSSRGVSDPATVNGQPSPKRHPSAAIPSREDAWNAYLSAEPPLPSAPEWRRTDYASLGLDRLKDRGGRPELDGGELSIVAPPEAVVLSLEDALRDSRFAAQARRVLEADPVGSYAKIEFLSRALAAKDLMVFIPPAADSETVVRVTARASDGFAFPRFSIFAAPESRAIVIEEHVGASSNGPSASQAPAVLSFSRLFLGAGASVKHFYLQDLPMASRTFWRQTAEIESSATLAHASLILGGALHKSDLEVRLRGTGAGASLWGALMGSGTQKFDFHSRQVHDAPKTQSRLLFNAALKDRARAVYTGLVRIEKTASDSDAYQENHNLLLSDSARADTTPLLEILTDSVRCKHGATAGAPDPEDLFYVESRGLSPEEAQETLVMGFFSPLLGQIHSPELASRLEDRIAQKLREQALS
jgi:Fe-S cluster assembly protein SufD